MRWSGDFDSYGRHTAALALTRTSVFVCVGVCLFLCLFMPSVSYAFSVCSNETDMDFEISSLPHSGVWKPDGESIIVEKLNTPTEWNDEGVEGNVEGVKHLRDWNLRGADEDINKALEHFREAEKHEYPPALNNLGVIHLNGWGVDKDIEKAKEYFERSSEGGYIPAMNNLGVIELREAPNDPEIRATAVERIQQAASWNSPYPPALNNLGILSLEDQGYAEAVNHFESAAELDYAPALFNLGVSYARGYGGQKNYREAAKLYKEAAQKGSVDAQYSLGLMYSQGIGVKKDLVESFVWLDIAKEHGFAEAAEVQGWVEELLTEDNVSDATSCVKEISPKIHAMNPFTLYYDVAAVPELYGYSERWYSKGTQE